MNITILGTGRIAHAIATRMLAGGNSCTLLTRDMGKAADLMQQLSPLAKGGATVRVAALHSPISDPVVINTIWYQPARDVIAAYAQQLDGRILVDVTNPLNSTFDDLVVPPDTSAAEELAKLAPGAHVVKAFNTTLAGPLTQGQVALQALDVLIAGDDADAKATVAHLVEAGGQRPMDVGPLKRARQLEGLGLLLMVMMAKFPRPWMSAIKLVM